MSQRWMLSAIATLGALSLFLVGLFHQYLDFKTLSIFALAMAGILILSIPMKWAIRLFFAYLGFEGLVKIVSNYHPAVHVGVDLLVLALSIKTLTLLVLGKVRQQEVFPPLTFVFLLHAAWFLVTIANPFALSLYASLAGAKIYITMLLLFFFAFYLNRQDPNETKVIMGIWVGVTLIHTLVAFYQASIGPTSVTQIHPGYATVLAKYVGRAFRPFGLTHIPGMPAVFIFLSTPFLFYFIISGKSFVKKLALTAIIPLWLVMLFVCQIRSSLLKAILGGLFFVVVYHVISFFSLNRSAFKKLAATSTIALIVSFSVPFFLGQAESVLPDGVRAIQRTMTLFDVDTIAHARRGTSDRFLDYLKMVPFGAGLSRTGAAAGKFQYLAQEADDPFGPIFFTDNFWVATLVDLGLPGMFLITILIGLILWRGLKHCRRLMPPEIQYLHLALLAGLFASAIGMYGSEAMLYNPEAAYFWYFSGCLVRLQVDHQSTAGDFYA